MSGRAHSAHQQMFKIQKQIEKLEWQLHNKVLLPQQRIAIQATIAAKKVQIRQIANSIL